MPPAGIEQAIRRDASFGFFPERSLPDPYPLIRDFVFKVDNPKPGQAHRLTLADLNQLRRYGDPQQVDLLERTIVFHRMSFLLAKVLGAASEGTVAYTSAAKLKGTYDSATYPFIDGLAIFGLMANDFATQVIGKHAKEAMGGILSQVLEGIANNYKAEEKLFGLDLGSWAGSVANSLTEAEEFPSLSLEMVPPTLAIGTGLLAQEQIKTCLFLVLFNTASTSTLYFAMQKTDNLRLGKLYKTLSHSLSTLAKYGTVVASRFSNIASANELSMVVAALSTSHLATLPENVDELAAGRTALAEMRAVFDKLGISLVSPALREEHQSAILSGIDPFLLSSYRSLESARSQSYWRYRLLDKAISAEYGENIPASNFACFHDFTFALGERVFLNHADLLLEGGQVHQLIGEERSGRSVVLRALADEINHQEGLTFFRYPKRDIELHESGLPLVALHHCANIPDNYVPGFNGVPPEAIILTYLEQTGMFTTEEINSYYSNYIYLYRNEGSENLPRLTASLRTRLKIAEAFLVAGRAPIHLFDDPFVKLENQEEVEKVALFLSRMAKKWGYVILITQRSDQPIAADTFYNQGTFGKVLQINEGKFKEVTTSRTTPPESSWQ